MTAELNIPIDRSSPVPLYHQVVQGIEAAIRSGALESGSRLDNEIELAGKLKLSRPTMRKAMDELVRAGLLVRKRGVGTQVVSSQVRRHLELSSLFDDLQRTGQQPATEVLEFRHGAAEAEVACRVRRDEGSVAPTCALAGTGREGAQCLRSEHCAAGFECVAPGRCQHYCCSLACGPIVVDASCGSPTRTLAAAAAASSSTCGNSLCGTSMRDGALQLWPVLVIIDITPCVTALGRSAPSRMMLGDLPPSSSATFLTVSAAALSTWTPARVERRTTHIFRLAPTPSPLSLTMAKAYGTRPGKASP